MTTKCHFFAWITYSVRTSYLFRFFFLEGNLWRMKAEQMRNKKRSDCTKMGSERGKEVTSKWLRAMGRKRLSLTALPTRREWRTTIRGERWRQEGGVCIHLSLLERSSLRFSFLSLPCDRPELQYRSLSLSACLSILRSAHTMSDWGGKGGGGAAGGGIGRR